MGAESSHCGHDDKARGKVTSKAAQIVFGLVLGPAFARFIVNTFGNVFKINLLIHGTRY